LDVKGYAGTVAVMKIRLGGLEGLLAGSASYAVYDTIHMECVRLIETYGGDVYTLFRGVSWDG
jgi:hypothetical protein